MDSSKSSKNCLKSAMDEMNELTGGAEGSNLQTQLVAFMKVFREMECASCNSLVAFQHRGNGKLYCVQSGHDKCHTLMMKEASDEVPVTSMQSNPEMTNAVKLSGMTGDAAPVKLVSTPGPLPVPKELMETMGGRTLKLVDNRPLIDAVDGSSRNLASVFPKPGLLTIGGYMKSPEIGAAASLKDAQEDAKMKSPVVRVTPDLNPKELLESVKESLRKATAATAELRQKNLLLDAAAKANLLEDEATTTKSLMPDVKAPYLFSNCKYSPGVQDGSIVAVAFAYDATNYLLTGFSDATELARLDAVLNEYAPTAHPLTATPKVGEMVIAKYKQEDGSEGYYRGRVTMVAEETLTCNVEFVDYGDGTVCKFSELLQVNDEIMKHPIYGLRVHLENLPKDPQGLKLTDELYTVILENAFLLAVGDKDVTPSEDYVEASLLRGGTTLNEMILKALWPAGAGADLPVISWSKCKFSPNLVNRALVEIQHQYSPKKHHVVAVKDLDDLTQFQTVIADYVKTGKRLTAPPVIDQIVLGSYGGEDYYRGRVTKIEGDKCTVSFVDYGDSNVCAFSDLVEADEVIMKRPIYGMVAELSKVPTAPERFQLDQRLISALEQRLSMDLKAPPTTETEANKVRFWNPTREFCINEEMANAIKNVA